MKRILTAMVLAATFGLASPAYAEITNNDINLSGLTETEKAALVSAAEQARDAKTVGPAITPKAAQEWALFGEQIGRGLAATARELGIAANEILNTPVGMMTAGLLVWHFAGNDIIGVLFGLVWISIFCPVWIWMYRRLMYTVEITEYEAGKGPNGKKKVKTIERNPIRTEGEGFILFMYIAVLVGGMLVGLVPLF